MPTLTWTWDAAAREWRLPDDRRIRYTPTAIVHAVALDVRAAPMERARSEAAIEAAIRRATTAPPPVQLVALAGGQTPYTVATLALDRPLPEGGTVVRTGGIGLPGNGVWLQVCSAPLPLDEGQWAEVIVVLGPET